MFSNFLEMMPCHTNPGQGNSLHPVDVRSVIWGSFSIVGRSVSKLPATPSSKGEGGVRYPAPPSRRVVREGGPRPIQNAK